LKNLKDEPRLVQDLWNIINKDGYAWIPIWGKARCGKTSLAMRIMYKIYGNWDDVLNGIVFNLNQLLYKIKRGEPKLFPTVTKPCHMRVPILLLDDFASSCGKAKTQHERVWDLFKGSFDTLGTRIGVLLGTMIEPTSPTQQLLLKYTHEIMVTKLSDNTRIYKYDTCTRQQDYGGWKTRQKKDWIEEQEFVMPPLKYYKQYDEMRMSLVDETFVTMQDQMSEDSVDDLIRKIEPIDHTLIRLIKKRGPIHHHVLTKEFGEQGKEAMVRCKARGLIVPRRKSASYYTYDITDLALDVIKKSEVSIAKHETSQFS